MIHLREDVNRNVRNVTVQAMLKTIRLLCITVSAGRSRSVKNAADTKLFAAPGLAKSKYRRFSRPTSTAMHKRRSKNQVGLNCNQPGKKSIFFIMKLIQWLLCILITDIAR